MAEKQSIAAELDRLLGNKSALVEALGYRKFVRAQRLKVLLLDGAYHLHKEVRRALCALGHEVASARADFTTARENLTSLLTGMVQHRPDFVLLINHIGLDAEGAMGALLERLGMPVACWYCDSPMFVLRQGILPGPGVTSLFVWEKSLMEPLRALGAQDVHHLPLACDDTVFLGRSDGPSAPNWPVSFVGDSMQRPLRVWQRRIQPQERKLTDTLRDGLIAQRKALWEPMLKMRQEVPHLPVWDILAVATFEATQAYRKRVLQSVDTEELHVVGDDGWASQLKKAQLHPPRDYGEALVSVYRRSLISLNATSLQMPSAVNQRIFDVPMAGGFVISDAQDDLYALFAEGREVVAYTKASDVPSLVDYYRKHEAERERISCQARLRIQKEHTYRHRLARMCRIMMQRHRSILPVSSKIALSKDAPASRAIL